MERLVYALVVNGVTLAESSNMEKLDTVIQSLTEDQKNTARIVTKTTSGLQYLEG